MKIYYTPSKEKTYDACEVDSLIEEIKDIYQNIEDYYKDDCGVHPMYPLKETRNALYEILKNLGVIKNE